MGSVLICGISHWLDLQRTIFSFSRVLSPLKGFSLVILPWIQLEYVGQFTESNLLVLSELGLNSWPQQSERLVSMLIADNASKPNSLLFHPVILFLVYFFQTTSKVQHHSAAVDTLVASPEKLYCIVSIFLEV